MVVRDHGERRGGIVTSRVGQAFARWLDSLLGLLVSQTMVVRKTRKIDVINLVVVDLWLRVFLGLRAEFVSDEGNNLLEKNGFHY